MGWGIINSSLYAQSVTKRLSDFTTPNMFYAAFPFGLYDPRTLLKHRKHISSKEKFYLSHNGKTVKSGSRLGFTFSFEDVRAINRHINSEGTGVYKQIGEFVKGDSSAWSERLPAEEQYSARFFSIEKVFAPLQLSDNIVNLDWFYDMSTWENYKKFMGGKHFLKRPAPVSGGILPPIGVDDD